MVIEDIKTLLDAIGGMEGAPLYALFAILGYLSLKWFGTAAIVLVLAKLLIVKVHDWGISKNVTVNETTVKLDKEIITVDPETAEYVLLAIKEAKKFKENGSKAYLHASGAKILFEVVQEKIEKENKND